ncbi:MAG: tRNA pseudouridine(38-40) synthase TruA [Candidatus Riflebacteria bacterium]|nr:tRNA pseudouridine(38-40) synthase TruA [Candidatus Riflebacteria bacterium]
MKRNIKLTVTYDGSGFFGFQLQPEVPTVQGTLEKVLQVVLGEKVRVAGSGRTDTGVHACRQVVAFETRCPIPVDKLLVCMNSRLPETLRILTVQEVPEDFHPRFSAKGKHYRYVFRSGAEFSPFLARYCFQIPEKLDFEKMAAAAPVFTGKNDFAAFARSPDRYENTVREVFTSEVEKSGDFIFFDVSGSGFLHNMVRNMAKAFYLIGKGEMQPFEIDELYQNRDRTRLGNPAPAGGLYLMKVMY